ncbi:MAG: LLM class flavin-dependent oxidoreductase [Rubellimicrobium sp.]|nr:LLM class flavin-dependent oxidoreductase [Rubellimicrobium sp.]
MPSFDAILIGNDTLTREAGRMTLEAGHAIRAVVTRAPAVRDWARGAGLTLIEPGPDLAGRLPEADWILSVANLDIIAPATLARARRGAVNFHDGPLPRHAGLNAPVWALLEGDRDFGITWHLIEGGVDEGPILLQRRFEIAPDDTALSLNGKCFAAALESFPEVIAALAAGPQPVAQDPGARTLHARDDRPAHGGRIDPRAGTADILRLVRALDHGDYANPLTTARVVTAAGWFTVTHAEPATGAGSPGTVLAAEAAGFVMATGEGAVRLSGLRDVLGHPVAADRVVRQGEVIAPPAGNEAALLRAALKDEGHWRAAMLDRVAADVPALGGRKGTGALAHEFTHALHPDAALARFAAMIAEGDGRAGVDFALARAGGGLLSDRVPVRFTREADFPAALSAARARMPYPGDLALRLGALPPALPVALGDDPGAGLLPGTALTFAAAPGRARLMACPDQVSPAAFALLAARLDDRLSGGTGLSPADHALIAAANAGGEALEPATIDALVSRQAALTPDAPALTCEDRTLTHAQADRAANRIAHRLIAAGVGAGTPVALSLGRSEMLPVAVLAIWKAGGAYVPLDPAYPAARIAHYLADSAAPVILTTAALAPALPAHGAKVVLIEEAAEGGDDRPPAPRAGAADPAYVIYTSGSTGTPKGVVVEHRQVANFMAGMDAILGQERAGTWLAVTSLSFDISVLELFWTLARGFHVVVAGDEERALVAGGAIGTGRRMDFSIFLWGNDDGVGRDKYTLLLETARFADENGFAAIWTPERHFHAFGGPYPNPAVTGAAVAAITRNIAVRSGSVVAPLHHPIRIAEDWAVIDNLTNGRAGLGIASGWHPDDFVLRPENAPPENKKAMLRAIEEVRRLWAGGHYEADMAHGHVSVQTQPRPVSAELPIWLTTAGNPDTWREAGAIGANVLTHLLGQSVAEVAEKIRLYHDALRASGRDPKDHTVTLMLHTYLAETRESAREVARKPLQDYLVAAAGLLRQYAWTFPAFKRPKGMDSPRDIDITTFDAETVQAILDYAFDRYFEDSGLFGTVDDALARVEELKRIGVDEVACLIDYGIERQAVLDGLRPLAQVVARANRPDTVEEGDFSLAAQIVRHGVTHLQCTPSMARMLVTNEDSRTALGRIGHLLVGGEALSGALAADLRRATEARIINMYGPTETTIWSTSGPADAGGAVVPIGRPMANQQAHVLDEAMNPVPPGVAGELWIGGAGVARGYLGRDDLTADRFRPDPFRAGGRLYRTGDLARWRADGALDFLGRADGQVKLRGHRIETGEIEAALESCAGVGQAAVLPREDVSGVIQLVGYVTGEARDEAALRAELAERLPAHMVPARIVHLAAFPLTPNRKIDRNALPAPAVARAPAPAAAQPAQPAVSLVAVGGRFAQGEVQRRVAEVWARILGTEEIAPRDSFFDLGGHSLLAVQAHRDLREALGVRALSITDIFRFPTLAALTERIEALIAPAPAPDDGGSDPAGPGKDGDPGARADAMARRRELRARRAGER